MHHTHRSALRIARSLRSRPVQRRLESSSHGESSHSHSSSPHGHGHAQPVNESFGRNFFLTLAAIPVSLAVYSYSTSTPESPAFLTRWIEAWTTSKEEWSRANALHTQMVEQMAFDRNLFFSEGRDKGNESGRGKAGLELRFQEVFNGGSPFNRSTSDNVNLDALIEHYREKNRKMEEKIRAKTQD